jgi:hypothetical protein
MKKFLESKTVHLLLGCLSLLGLLVLTASLSRMQFKPGAPFQYIRNSPAGTVQQSLSPFPLYCGVVIVIVSFIVLLISLTPKQRKRLVRLLAVFILIGAGLLWVLSVTSTAKPLPQPDKPIGPPLTTGSPEATGTPEPEVVPANFTPPEVNSWEAYFVTLGVLTAAGVGVWWLTFRRRKGSSLRSALASIAQSALKELEVGRDWGDTVINSYYRMTLAVEDWRGIRRRSGMTPTEFSEFLVGFGLPPEAIGDLTGLFEKVRYGRRKATREETRAAVVCLNAIMKACQELG